MSTAQPLLEPVRSRLRALAGRLAPRPLLIAFVRVDSATSEQSIRSWRLRRWIDAPQATLFSTQCLASPATRIEVRAGLGSRLVGRATGARMWAQLEMPGFWLGGVWVHPRLRRCGLGARLVRSVEAQAHAAGHDELLLNVAADNLPAIRLYRAVGYTVFAAPGWHAAVTEHLRAHGVARAQLFMRKRLSVGKGRR